MILTMMMSMFETTISEVAPTTVGSKTTMLDGDNGSASCYP
jgi:hypothetical protein